MNRVYWIVGYGAAALAATLWAIIHGGTRNRMPSPDPYDLEPDEEGTE